MHQNRHNCQGKKNVMHQNRQEKKNVMHQNRQEKKNVMHQNRQKQTGARSVPAPLGQRACPPLVGHDPLPRCRVTLALRPAMRGGNANGRASESNRRARARASLRVSPRPAPCHADGKAIEGIVRFASE